MVTMFAWRASTPSARACEGIDHAGESDVDLLVVVGERTPEVERAVVDSCVAEELRSGVPFDPVIKDSASFALERRHHTPFYENIAREGIAV